MRQLVHIPVVHSQADMGSAQSEIQRAYIERRGESEWEKSRQAIAGFWAAIDAATDDLRLDDRNVRLYQDGLPVCGFEDRIVRDLAAQGGPNYRILLKLLDRGATLEGTEDPDLLRAEYELITKTAPGAAIAGSPETAAQFRDLLDRRDSFIAHRIDTTLKDGETGILFLGALHRAVEKLPRTVHVLSLADMLRASAPSLKG